MKIMKYICLFLIFYFLHYNLNGQNFSLDNELKIEKLIYQKINKYKIVVIISESMKLYIESYPSLKKTTVSLNGKLDTLRYYVDTDYFSSAHKSNLNSKKIEFIILKKFPSYCTGLSCSVTQTSIIELRNNRICGILYFSTFDDPLNLMRVRGKKLYVHILTENNITAEYLGISNSVYSMTTFLIDKKRGLVYKETDYNGCYKLLDDRKLLKIDCPFGYAPLSKPDF